MSTLIKIDNQYNWDYILILSKLIILKYLISSPSQTAIRKTGANGILNWMIGLTGYPSIKSLSIDAAEQSVYLWISTSGVYNSFGIISLSASTGSINSAYEM